MSKRASAMASANGDAKKDQTDVTSCRPLARPPSPRHPFANSVSPAAAYDKQKVLLSSEVGHFSLIRALHLADLITELNGFCGIMSVFSSMRYALGDPASLGNLYAALAFLPLGLFFDFMDGKVARWRKKSSMMGQELDSLADLVRSSSPGFLCVIWGYIYIYSC